MRGSGAEQRLLRGCSGAVALRAVCPAQITAGVPDYAVVPQVAEKPVSAVGRDLRHRAHPPASLAAAQFVIRNARGREVLDLNKDTVGGERGKSQTAILGAKSQAKRGC